MFLYISVNNLIIHFSGEVVLFRSKRVIFEGEPAIVLTYASLAFGVIFFSLAIYCFAQFYRKKRVKGDKESRGQIT